MECCLFYLKSAYYDRRALCEFLIIRTGIDITGMAAVDRLLNAKRLQFGARDAKTMNEM